MRKLDFQYHRRCVLENFSVFPFLLQLMTRSFVPHTLCAPRPLSGQHACLLLVVSHTEQPLVPSRPQFGASSAGPVWRRVAYKLYPPGDQSLSTMLLFTGLRSLRHSHKPNMRLSQRFKDMHAHTIKRKSPDTHAHKIQSCNSCNSCTS